MAEIIRKTEDTFSGPWLLDSTALSALDEVIDEQWARLEAHKREQIEAAVVDDKEILRRRYQGDARTIVLTLSSGNKVRVKSFREAADDVSCQDHEVTKIEVRLYCGGIRGDLVVPVRSGLSLVTLPEASERADELFVRLRRWAEQYKPDWFRQICGIGPVVWFLYIFFLFILLMIGSMGAADTWEAEVRELVARGVKPEDQGRALELILQKEARLSSGSRNLPTWFFIVAIVSAGVATLLSFKARTAFEIGRGARSVRRQKRYDRFLRIFLPTFLIMGILASVLGSVLFEYIRK